MKVLQVNCIYGVKSTGRTTMEMAIELEKNGHEACVAYASGDCDFHNSYRIGNKLDQKLHAFLSRLFGLQGYFSVLPTYGLIKYIKAEKPDIVHLRNLHSNYININMLLNFLAKSGTATVVTLHDCFFYTGKCTHYTVDKCYKWQESCGNCKRLKRDNASWFFDRTRKVLRDRKKYFSKIDKLAVIGVSKWVTNEAKRSVLGNAAIIDTVYNWINLDAFKPRENNLREKLNLGDKFVILSVASQISASKGIEDIIELSKRLGDACRIVLIGKLSYDISAYKNIVAVGEVKQVEELAKYYNMADCTISCSLEETFGKTLAESLACGTPVCVYNSTALPELAGDRCGHIAEVGDIEGFCKNIERIKENGKLMYAQECVKYAQTHFDMKKNINSYISTYQKLLSGEIIR